MNIKIVSIRRWLIMMVLSISGGTIYFLPILQEVYYQPLATALNLDNTQVGSLVSIFGVFAMLSYLPGGWVADKVSPRILLSSSLLLTGFLGLYFATLPRYPMSLLIHAIWGITTSLLFWGAVVRVTRNWASADDQGKAFGFLQTGRGLVEILVSMAILAVFGYLGGTNFALSVVITLFSILIIFSGILSWVIIKDDDDGKYSSSQFSGSPIRDIITVLKLPVVWLIAIVVLAAYSAYWGTYRFTSYSSDIFGMSIIMAGVIGVGKMWMNPPAAFMAGFIADKNGIAKSVSVLFIILVISFVIFAFMPGIPSLIPMMIINIAIASFAVFALRGIYFALLEEGGVPKGVTGTAAGFISMIGFTPDIFMPLMGGILLDTLPGDQGYRYFFLIVAGICFIGCMASVTIYRQINNKTAR